MAFCSNCGREVPDGAKFCANCGATIEMKNKAANNETFASGFSTNNTTFERNTMGDFQQEEPPKKTWVDKLSKFFGIILLIIAYLDYHSDPPALTIVLSIAIILGAIFCLSQKYKLKFFTIIALFLALYCLRAGINQGKRLGFFKIPSASDYRGSSINTTVDETRVDEKESREEVADTNEAESEYAKEEPYVTETVEEEEKTEVKTADGVDPDLKAFLDSYEEFMDEYVVFMKKYTSEPGNAFSMLAEYTKMMQKYEDFAKKIDKYDSDTMSTADAKYYLDVTNRCTQKILDLY